MSDRGCDACRQPDCLGTAVSVRQGPRLGRSPFSFVVLVQDESDHRLHGLLEIGAAIDSPIVVESDSLLRGIDHRVCGINERNQCRHRQSSVPSPVILELGAIGFGDGPADAVDHAPRLGGATRHDVPPDQVPESHSLRGPAARCRATSAWSPPGPHNVVQQPSPVTQAPQAPMLTALYRII